MNSLSWLMYAADVVGTLRSTFGVTAVASGIGIVVVAEFTAIAASFGVCEGGTWKRVLGKWWIPAALALGAAITPSTNTIYQIAASEAGEVIVTSPDAIEMMNDLKAVIKKRLKAELAD